MLIRPPWIRSWNSNSILCSIEFCSHFFFCRVRVRIVYSDPVQVPLRNHEFSNITKKKETRINNKINSTVFKYHEDTFGREIRSTEQKQRAVCEFDSVFFYIYSLWSPHDKLLLIAVCAVYSQWTCRLQAQLVSTHISIVCVKVSVICACSIPILFVSSFVFFFFFVYFTKLFYTLNC